VTVLLFAECVLPGCRELVAAAGEVCPGCVAAFGPRLRPVPDAEPLTEPAIMDRDQAVAQHYQDRRHSPAADDGREWKSNQSCWMCEQRRRCARTDQGWECRDCLTVAG
jgi:hypothetical protein